MFCDILRFHLSNKRNFFPGYYGRPIQTRNKVNGPMTMLRKTVVIVVLAQVKGGAFDSTEKDYFRWIVGSGTAVAALDEVVQQMHQVCY